MQNYELAENDYMSGMKYKDIAREIWCQPCDSKSWKTRYTAGIEKVCIQKQRKVCIQKDNIEHDKEPVADEIESVLQNTELTEKQRLFVCIL